MASATTPDTEKGVPRLAIAFVDTITRRTGLGGVSRVDKDHRDTGQASLVENLLPQIMERPAVQLSALFAPVPYPVADARKVLQGNTASGALRRFDNAFADAVVDITGKAGFFTRKLLESAFGCFRAFLLQVGAQALVTMAHALDVAAGMEVAVTVHGNVADSQVDTQEVVDLLLGRSSHLAGRHQVEPAPNVNQVALPLRPCSSSS